MPDLTLSTAMDAFLAETASASQKTTVRSAMDAEKAVPITNETPSSAYTISAPEGTYSAGHKKSYYITPSGSQTLDFTGIAIPSDSALTLPKTLDDGKLYIVQITYSGTFWMLTSIVGGYTSPA